MKLQKYKDIIRSKHKEKNFMDFIEDVCSWYPLRMYKKWALYWVYPGNERHAPFISQETFEANRESLPSFSYDEKKSFFDQFTHLFRAIQLPGFHHYYSVENSEYSNHISSTSHAYSSFHVTGDCERVMYSLSTKIYAKNVYNSVMTWIYSENVYQSLGTIRSMNVYYSKYIQDSHDIWFSCDLIGCSECIFCHDQANISYAIDNVIYPKEIYEAKKQEILSRRWEFDHYYAVLAPLGKSRGSSRTTGKYCSQSEDVENGNYSIHVKNGKNILFTGHPDGLSDVYNSLFVSAGSGYYGACGVGGDSEEIYNSISIMRSFECYYSYFLERCSFCIGCVGLKNKSYCILNKQYTQDEWYIAAEKIFASMEASNTLWEYFPGEICPFYIEDSLAGMMLGDIAKSSLSEKWFLISGKSENDTSTLVDAISSETLSHYEQITGGNYTIDASIEAKIFSAAIYHSSCVYCLLRMQ